jgi:ACR3 family arsenite efflux pump ArsB
MHIADGVLFLFIYLLFLANGKELTTNLILIIASVFPFLLFFIYIEMGITGTTDIIKEKFNNHLALSSLF